jgi:hypothetical protein
VFCLLIVMVVMIAPLLKRLAIIPSRILNEYLYDFFCIIILFSHNSYIQ